MIRPVIGLQEAMYAMKKYTSKRTEGNRHEAKIALGAGLMICATMKYDIEELVGELLKEMEEDANG